MGATITQFGNRQPDATHPTDAYYYMRFPIKCQ